MANLVAIVGRPNVGKSTLFNRLTESRQAIVDEISGVTRDRHYGKAEWNGIQFSLVDTGGYILGSDDIFEGEIRKQVKIAIDESTAIFFVVDVTEGITEFDKEVAGLIRKSKKPVIIVANKSDNHIQAAYSGEFYQLGLGEVFPISAISGSGTGELLDKLVEILPVVEETIEDKVPRISIIGRPNVGKSSLANALLGEERNIVTEIAGTTRDSIHSRYKKFGHDFILVDTAGMRKKAKVHEDLEFYSVMRTINAIENSDVCILMLDAQQGMEAQDLSILSLVERNRKGLVIVVNKWDLVENKETNTAVQYEEQIREKIAPFRDIPMVFTSVKDKQRIMKVVDVAMHVYANKTKHVPTRKLNDYILPVIEHTPPQSVKGKHVKVKYVTQLKTEPLFIFYCNLPQYVTESYKRFLENKLREEFDFTGVPIVVSMRKK